MRVSPAKRPDLPGAEPEPRISPLQARLRDGGIRGFLLPCASAYARAARSAPNFVFRPDPIEPRPRRTYSDSCPQHRCLPKPESEHEPHSPHRSRASARSRRFGAPRARCPRQPIRLLAALAARCALSGSQHVNGPARRASLSAPGNSIAHTCDLFAQPNSSTSEAPLFLIQVIGTAPRRHRRPQAMIDISS
jgi:hypothetical protein